MAEIKPLTFEQLKERVGKPVYWPNDLVHGNLWGIVDFDQSFPDDLWFCNCNNGVQTVLNIKMRDMKLYDTEIGREYEDTEEKGGTSLPFKVGDTVYFRIKEYSHLEGGIVDFIQNQSITQIIIREDYIHFKTASREFDVEDDIGKTVFFTREEAERVLYKKEGE